jgi:hypothetical protein
MRQRKTSHVECVEDGQEAHQILNLSSPPVNSSIAELDIFELDNVNQLRYVAYARLLRPGTSFRKSLNSSPC